MGKPKFEIEKSTNDQFYFNLKAENGKIILTSSETYTQKHNCKKGIESVKANAPNEDRYEKKDSSNDKYYFILKANNGEPIGKSQMYETIQGRDNGIESVMENAADAETVDLT